MIEPVDKIVGRNNSLAETGKDFDVGFIDKLNKLSKDLGNYFN